MDSQPPKPTTEPDNRTLWGEAYHKGYVNGRIAEAKTCEKAKTHARKALKELLIKEFNEVFGKPDEVMDELEKEFRERIKKL